MVKQWRSREMLQFMYASFLVSKLYEAVKEKFQFGVGRMFPEKERFCVILESYSIFSLLKAP